jgi:hypothetical protein
VSLPPPPPRTHNRAYAEHYESEYTKDFLSQLDKLDVPYTLEILKQPEVGEVVSAMACAELFASPLPHKGAHFVLDSTEKVRSTARRLNLKLLPTKSGLGLVTKFLKQPDVGEVVPPLSE